MEVGEIRFEKTCTLDLDGVRALGRAQLGNIRKYSIILASVASIIIALNLFLLDGKLDFFMPALLVALAILIPLIPRLTAKASMKKQQNLLLPTRYRFGEEAFSQEMELIHSVISYKIIERIVLCKDYLLLYPTGYVAYVLPLRNFAAGEAEALPDFLAGRTGKKVERIGRAR